MAALGLLLPVDSRERCACEGCGQRLDTATRLSCAVLFDPAIFSHCWLFASYGGWRNHNVAVLEPCTGYPVNFDAMRAAGRHRTLVPGQTLATDVLFVVQSGIDSVAEVGRDGVISPA